MPVDVKLQVISLYLSSPCLKADGCNAHGAMIACAVSAPGRDAELSHLVRPAAKVSPMRQLVLS